MSLRTRIERLECEALRLMPPSQGLWGIDVHPESSHSAMGYPPGVWWNGDRRMPSVKIILQHGEKPDPNLMAVLSNQLAPWGTLGGQVSVVVGKGPDGEQFLRCLRDRVEAAGVSAGLEMRAAPAVPVQGIAGQGFSLSGALAWTAAAVTIAEEGITFEAGLEAGATPKRPAILFEIPTSRQLLGLHGQRPHLRRGFDRWGFDRRG